MAEQNNDQTKPIPLLHDLATPPPNGIRLGKHCLRPPALQGRVHPPNLGESDCGVLPERNCDFEDRRPGRCLMNNNQRIGFCENQFAAESSLFGRLRGQQQRPRKIGNPALRFVRHWLTNRPKQHKTTLPRPTSPLTFRQFSRGLFNR